MSFPKVSSSQTLSIQNILEGLHLTDDSLVHTAQHLCYHRYHEILKQPLAATRELAWEMDAVKLVEKDKVQQMSDRKKEKNIIL